MISAKEAREARLNFLNGECEEDFEQINKCISEACVKGQSCVTYQLKSCNWSHIEHIIRGFRGLGYDVDYRMTSNFRDCELDINW